MVKSLSSFARLLAACLAFAVLAASAPLAQAETPAAPPTPSIERSILAVSYGAGTIPKAELKGTDLAPNAAGSAAISAKQGSVRISVSVRNLPEAASFGPQYLTYVAWAVTFEGKPRNLGEIAVKKGKGKLQTTTPIQAFGLAVTAEPHFAVSTPSEMLMLQNVFTGKAAEKAAPTEVRFVAFPRNTFSSKGLETPDPAAKVKVPLELYEARNAVSIAKAFGADTYAADSYTRAAQTLEQAEAFFSDKKYRKMAAPKARESVQAAEAARVLSVQKIEEVRVAAEKADAAGRTSEAQAEAARAQADAAAARASAEKSQAEAGAAQARAVEAEAMAAEEARRRADAEAEKHALREKLLKQFNLILETRDSARGLIVNLGDVLFDLDKYTLRPEAREKLAKLSGIVLGNPGLKLEVEGHTDSTGSDEYNQKLSENRAGAVRDYLASQNVPADSISAHGFGKTRPVAPNDTAENRQKNRRVEIVVSGDIIGTEAAP